MTTLELNTRKLKFVKEFLNEEDEHLVKELMFFFMDTKYGTKTVPGVPSTVEELKASVAQGMEDYRNGRVTSQEELEKEIATW
jgi:hypothetical protein